MIMFNFKSILSRVNQAVIPTLLQLTVEQAIQIRKQSERIQELKAEVAELNSYIGQINSREDDLFSEDYWLEE